MKYEDVLVSPETSIRDVLQKIDAASTQMALVVDQRGVLLGMATDGDIRRGLLAGQELDSPIRESMHQKPMTVSEGATDTEIIALLKAMALRHAPVIDDDGRVMGLKVLDELLQARRRDNPVVLMAGGLGARLGELTRNTPKPMLPIGGRPILEHILMRLIDQGFQDFWISVNFRAEVIEAHFGDGSKFGCSVRYLRETKRLGTAGALSLLPGDSQQPIVVTNGDLLTNADFGALLDHHERTQADATMAVRPHDIQVPYGVIEANLDQFVAVREKPVFQHIISAGIYVLSPAAVGMIPADTFFDMPDVFRELVGAGRPASVYRMADYWIDIGHPPDLERAERDFDGADSGRGS